MNMRLNFRSVSWCVIVLLGSVALAACGAKDDTAGNQSKDPEENRNGTVTKEFFGKLPDGRDAYLYTISNGQGLTVKATNYGGIITSIITPDKEGKPGDIVLGFDSLDQYTSRHPHMGPLIGRYSGYIAGAKFTLDGTDYRLAANSGSNHLHGGKQAFDKILWDATEVNGKGGPGLKLTYTSPDGEEGYPGNLDVTVTYTVTDDNELQITYEASTDKKTHVNLTNHIYFNLSNLRAEKVMQHELTIHATHYAVPGKGNIPTGELKEVANTPLDFSTSTPIGARIGELPNGYDHNYVLKEKNDQDLKLAASVYEPLTGRRMELFTTHTGLEFASAGWLNVKGKGGKAYGKSAGFLLYPQHLPDSPNRPDFPSTLLEPGKRYSEKTVYKFSTEGPASKEE